MPSIRADTDNQQQVAVLAFSNTLLLFVHQPSHNCRQYSSSNSIMADQTLDVNMFTSPFQLTKSMYRDLYPAIEPTNPALSAKGKVVIITGAGGGLGAVGTHGFANIHAIPSSYLYARQSLKHGHKLVLLEWSWWDVKPRLLISLQRTFPRFPNLYPSLWNLRTSRMNPASSRSLAKSRRIMARHMS